MTCDVLGYQLEEMEMQLVLRHKLLIAGATLIAAASAGGAYAATQSSTNPRQAYLNDVAKRLHVSPAQLRSALKGAMIDRLNAMVKAGQLTQAQANRIERRINEGGRLPLFFGGPGHRELGHWMHGALRGPLHAVSSYLGLTNMQLLNDLRSGQSLAQIATKQGKSVSGLEQTLTSAATSALDRAVAAGSLTKAQEQKLLSRLSARIGRLVNRTGFPRAQRVMPPPGMPLVPPPGGASGSGPAFLPPPTA
jgi:hypothetical protein